MLEGKVAIVTGGTRGIGYETVKKFLENGAKVALFGSREETVSKAIESLKKENANYEVIGLYPKLNNETEIKEAFEKVNNTYGRIDILVNNAGISSSTPLLNYTEEEYNKTVDTNIKGVFLCSKLIVPYMEKNGGSILNTSSMVSIYGQT